MVLKKQEESINVKFDEKILQRIRAFVDEHYRFASIAAITKLQNERYLVEVDDGADRAWCILFDPPTKTTLLRESTFGRWIFDEDGKETYLGK